MSERARLRREANIANAAEDGCLPADDYDEELLEAMSAAAVSISGWERGGDMPIIAWDSTFERYMRSRQVALQRIVDSGFSWFPWDIIPALPSNFRRGNQFAFSQQSVPSCAGFAAAFAKHASTLTDIALGQPMLYNPYNPLVTWVISKGGSMRGGQSIAAIGAAVNRHGNFPIEVAGDNVTRQPDTRTHANVALNYQSGLCWMPTDNLVDRVFEAAKAGFGIFLGNTIKVGGSSTDRNGVRVATLSGSWNHATSINSWVTVGGEEYVYWLNSHGRRYTAADILGSPADGAWMTKAIASRFLSTAGRYGRLGVVLSESIPVVYDSFEPIVKAVNSGLTR